MKVFASKSESLGRVRERLEQAATGTAFLPASGVLSFLGTVTVAYPVTGVVIPAALLRPFQWQLITLVCALGSGLGATLLAEAAHLWGLAQLEAWFLLTPDASGWQEALDWVGHYGIFSLFLVAASPLPQTPALLLLGVAGHSIPGMFAALFLGKVIKYGAVAWFSSRFPSRFGWSSDPVLRKESER